MRSIDVLKMRDPSAGGGVAYRYYRLTMSATTVAALLAMDEIEIYETSGGPNVATAATATASSDGFGWTPDHINDGLRVAVAGAGWHASVAAPQWLKLDFGSGVKKVCHSYTLMAAIGREDQAPSAFVWEGSNDDLTYTPLDSDSGLAVADWQGPIAVNGIRTYVV